MALERSIGSGRYAATGFDGSAGRSRAAPLRRRGGGRAGRSSRAAGGDGRPCRPCRGRAGYSARWKPFGQLLADGLLDDARAGEADQRARLGDVDVAEHGVGGGDAAGGRVGEDDDVGQPGLAQAPRRRRSCAASASATGCLPACARRRRRRRARRAAGGRGAASMPVMIASPAAMPSEPPMKSKSCDGGDHRHVLDRAGADHARHRRRPVLARASRSRSV